MEGGFANPGEPEILGTAKAPKLPWWVYTFPAAFFGFLWLNAPGDGVLGSFLNALLMMGLFIVGGLVVFGLFVLMAFGGPIATRAFEALAHRRPRRNVAKPPKTGFEIDPDF